MNLQKHAVIVGAGIGGLGTAVGLHRAGWKVTVLERADAFAPVGSGLSMYPNAMRALEALGLQSEVDKIGDYEVGHGLRSTEGAWLTKIDAETVSELWGGRIVGFHRADLHELLLSGIPDESVHLGVAVTSAEEGPDGKWVVRSADRIVADGADVVVAADGIRSVLRHQYWPELPGPTYTGSTAWRGVCPRPDGLEHSIVQTFGTGAEFGFLPLTNGSIYWYASAATPPGITNEDEKATVQGLYQDWHGPIPQLIEASPVVTHTDIYALPAVPSDLVHQRVVLVGDAGHGMTPHLGQGGCTALEDAVVLAAELSGTPEDISAALERYSNSRQPRVSELAALAEQIRRSSHESGEAGTLERNRTWPDLPPATIYKTSADVAQWFPPSIVTV